MEKQEIINILTKRGETGITFSDDKDLVYSIRVYTNATGHNIKQHSTWEVIAGELTCIHCLTKVLP